MLALDDPNRNHQANVTLRHGSLQLSQKFCLLLGSSVDNEIDLGLV